MDSLYHNHFVTNFRSSPAIYFADVKRRKGLFCRSKKEMILLLYEVFDLLASLKSLLPMGSHELIDSLLTHEKCSEMG